VKGRKTTFAKAYGIKMRRYGEHVGEHNGLKPMGGWGETFPQNIGGWTQAIASS